MGLIPPIGCRAILDHRLTRGEVGPIKKRMTPSCGMFQRDGGRVKEGAGGSGETDRYIDRRW
jgi:hypothetical protein